MGCCIKDKTKGSKRTFDHYFSIFFEFDFPSESLKSKKLIDMAIHCVQIWFFRLELCKPLQWSHFLKTWSQIAKSASNKSFILYWSPKSWTYTFFRLGRQQYYPPWFYSKNDKFQQIERFCFKWGKNGLVQCLLNNQIYRLIFNFFLYEL